MTELSVGIALVAGLVSFLSPCVLPVIPGFLAYLAGASLGTSPKEGSSGTKTRRDIFLASVFFVLGFSAVFSVLGVILNTVLERVAYDAQEWLARIGGAIIILFGLYLVGLVRIPFLEREYTLRPKVTFRSRYATSFVFGAAFAAGWTPCVGAVLGGILGLAAAAPGLAFTLLFWYSIGLGIPFLVVGAFASRASGFFAKYASAFGYVNKLFGVILVAIGILAFTQNLGLVANLELLNRFLLR